MIVASAAVEAIQERGGWLSLTGAGTLKVTPAGIVLPEELEALRADRETSWRLIAEGIGWSERTSSLIAWFLTHELPAVPFNLTPGVHVVSPPALYKKLRQEIASGPNSPRARSGVLEDELTILKGESPVVQQATKEERTVWQWEPAEAWEKEYPQKRKTKLFLSPHVYVTPGRELSIPPPPDGDNGWLDSAEKELRAARIKKE